MYKYANPYMTTCRNCSYYNMDFTERAFNKALRLMKEATKYNYTLNKNSNIIQSNNRETINQTDYKNEFSKEEAAAIALLLGINFSKSKFDLNQFWLGVNTELEHGKKYNQTNVTADEPITTGKIALAHLSEFPDYYTRLKALEEQAKAYWSTR